MPKQNEVFQIITGYRYTLWFEIVSTHRSLAGAQTAATKYLQTLNEDLSDPWMQESSTRWTTKYEYVRIDTITLED